MENFLRLNKNEMKMIMGGVDDTIDGCPASTCSSDTDCTESAFPKCHLVTCLATQEPMNFCGIVKS